MPTNRRGPIYRAQRRFIGPNTHQPEMPLNVTLSRSEGSVSPDVGMHRCAQHDSMVTHVASRECHPIPIVHVTLSRSEGSLATCREMHRCAQHDIAVTPCKNANDLVSRQLL
jgi:hypothetical protein